MYCPPSPPASLGILAGDLKHNTFLCSKKKYGDFELKFKIRLKGGVGNSGVQIRSKVEDPEKFVVAGPQCDIEYGEDTHVSFQFSVFSFQ